MLRLASILLCLTVAVSGFATTVRADGATVVVNEMPTLTLRASVGKVGPVERARVLALKLSKAATLDITVESTKRSAKIMSGGEVLILINKTEAARAGVTPGSLASTWVKNLREAWDLPPVRITKDAILLPVNGTASMDLVGSEARTALLSVEDKKVSSVARKGAKLTFTALAEGQTIFRVGEGDEAKTITVRVLPYAANFPQSFGVTVVGTPTSAATIKSVVEGTVRTRLQGVPGATWSWGAVSAEDLETGGKKTFAIRVKADSPDAFASEGIVNVTVTNLGLALRREAELWYCNDPENVKKPQSLFMADLLRDQPVRMLYHHINDSFQGMYLRVLVTNASDKPATLLMIPGDSKDKNPVLAGVLAADPFFRSWLAGSGEVVSIPAGASMPLAFRRLAPQETSSGLCYMRLLSGPDSLRVTTEALAPFELDAKWQAATRTPTPWREVGTPLDLAPQYSAIHSDVIYPSPFKQEEFTYTAGGNFSFFRIGQKPISRRDPGQALDGNFGVIYNIQARAENPTQTTADIELVFEASAGYSGALFSIDGQIVRLPLLQAKEEARLARFKLDPGGSKTINVTTIPLSGSSYPATLVLRPVSTLPALNGK